MLSIFWTAVNLVLFFSWNTQGTAPLPLIHLPSFHFSGANQLDSSVDLQLKGGIWLKKDGLGKTPAFLILMTSSLELCQREYPFETGHTTISKSKEPIGTYVSWVYGKGRALSHQSHSRKCLILR